MSKHTPGPWRSRQSARLMVTAGMPGTHAFFEIADVSPNQSQDANARLIAAAPELLEAVRLFLNRTNQNEAPELTWEETIAAGRAALVKAEGRAK